MTDPYLEWVWSPEYQDHYMLKWDGTFFWARRRDLDLNQDELVSSTDQAQAAILGTPDRGSYEELDPTYMIQNNPRQFFREGRMFAILFTEPMGETIRNMNNRCVTEVRFGQYAHCQIRRFIVVKNKRGFCYACPVSTYTNRGTTKRGVVPEDHAIVYTVYSQPIWVEGEYGNGMDKEPIAIIPTGPGEQLMPQSRVNFGIRHPIQHNVKVKDLGLVRDEDMPNLIAYARAGE